MFSVSRRDTFQSSCRKKPYQLLRILKPSVMARDPPLGTPKRNAASSPPIGWPGSLLDGPLVYCWLKFRLRPWLLASLRTNCVIVRNSAPSRRLCLPFCHDRMPESDSLSLLLIKYP